MGPAARPLCVVLASASPRRQALLADAGVAFAVAPTHVDETLPPAERPEEAAEALALRKAQAAVARWAQHGPEAGDLWIGADTIVALGENGPDLEYLEKPLDAADARRMLQRLSGSRHRVITGVAVLAVDAHGAVRDWVSHERTWVQMRPITAAEVDAYVASGEWEGKAGGYAIQETADAFVTGLEEGGFDNVVGLPVALTLRLLGQARASLAGGAVEPLPSTPDPGDEP
ncbi:MAG: Maf family protein [Planctomycetota bacterium]